MDLPVVAVTDPPADAGYLADDFESFFGDQRDRLFRALVLLTRDAHAADEITQDAFCRVWERWARVRRLDDPVGYLYRTALNVQRSAYRRAARAARRAMSGSDADVRDPLGEAEAREEALRVLAL